jgi:hypothetical protein
MTRYWISWYEPSEDPRPARDWQTAPDWWCTGQRMDGASTICAVVDAKTEAQAKKIVRKHWDPSEWRFCNVQASDWAPPADRFPCARA